MDLIVFTLMALIALYVVSLALRNRRKPAQARLPDQEKQASSKPEKSEIFAGRHNTHSETKNVVTVQFNTRSDDRNSYRFDGYAVPEYRIEYADADGVVTTREIYLNTWRSRGSLHYLDCWCFLRDERREFRSDRILSAINLSTNRRIKDIVAHRSRW
jgi:hypothetical protein